ncbi:class I SAM-dependent methyltransferase [Desulfobotulus mexicanus]|uniref:Methyltransferase n=1 Tax=Desulfobotulus mexicanus TaxID=2586642 RepID=A0A5Q4VED1_9BACT|nr:class I SAM-dependent methyltransferase [Desulfobotulus mexicanus]TYT75308.1 methyltransferase [Desulfobotulus mexicanus]
MSDWSSGYVSDIGYTYGYYKELNPLLLRLAFLNAGLVYPEVKTACELGFGQGLSVNIHAAASPGIWHGTDFNPSQAAFARGLADISGADLHLSDAAFDEFCAKDDLPGFDYIGLHGIWSWISDDNRAVIVDFIRRKLNVGGVLYISYNTLPGWAAFAPMRHLMTEHSEVMGAEGSGILSRIDASLIFAEKLMATQPLYARANTQIADRLTKVKEQNRHYLAHEYFNKDWHPMHVSTMGEWLEPAKLSYACSAHYMDHIDALNLTEEQQALLKDIPHPLFRETVRDFMVNQQFRRDYWVKGIRKLQPLEQAESIREQRVVLVSHRPDISLKVNGTLGEATMNEGVYLPILDFMADHKPKTIGQIVKAMDEKKISFVQVLQSVMVLAGAGHFAAVQEDGVIQKMKKRTDKLNAFIMDKARSSGDISYLASPVTGSGIQVGRFQQLYLLAAAKGKKQPAEQAAFVWDILAAQGQRIVKEGKALDTMEENIAEITRQAEEFAQKQLPVLKALQVG